MALLFDIVLRRGRTAKTLAIIPSQTAVEIRIIPDLADMVTRGGPITIACLVDQSPDGGAMWFTLGGFTGTYSAVAGRLHSGGSPVVDKFTGLPVAFIKATFTEEIRRADLCRHPTVHEYRAGGQLYKQYALCPTLRVAVDTYTVGADGKRAGDAGLRYGADVVIDARRRDWMV